MTDRVNSVGKQGDFLTGQMDFFTIATIVPVAQTNVSTPVQDLPGYQTLASTGVWSNVSVIDGNGVTQVYSSENTYLDAFYKQTNLNQLVKTFELRATPVAVTVANITVGAGNAATTTAVTDVFYGSFSNISAVTTHFGSAQTLASQVNFVQLISEKTGLWNVDTVTVDSNANGYQLLGLNGLQGVVAYDTVSAQVLAGTTATPVTTTSGSVVYGANQFVTTFDSTSPTNYNTLALVKVVPPYYK
jgi:hypothetical protein